MSNIFEKLEIFNGFNDKQIKGIFKLGERKLIDKSENLFKTDDASRGLYIVLGGKFSAKYNGVTKYFTAGAVFSELSLFDDVKHKLTVNTEQKSQYFFLSKEKYEKLKESSPKFALKFQENLLRYYLKKVENLEKIFLEKK